MPPETLYQSENLRILCHNPQAPNAVVVFDHRQVRDGDFATIQPSVKVTEAGFSYITVASKKNDWFLSSSLVDCHERITAYMAKYRRVVGFGSSMGGYGALAMSRTFRFKQVLVVSPQITVFPSKPPFDTRFEVYANELDPAFDTVSKHPRKGLGGVILFDPNQPNDLAHARIISELFPRLKRVPMSFAGHPALRLITQAKGFHHIQDELISNHISAFRLRQLHKTIGRASSEYRMALEGYLKARAARSSLHT